MDPSWLHRSEICTLETMDFSKAEIIFCGCRINFRKLGLERPLIPNTLAGNMLY